MISLHPPKTLRPVIIGRRVWQRQQANRTHIGRVRPRPTLTRAQQPSPPSARPCINDTLVGLSVVPSPCNESRARASACSREQRLMLRTAERLLGHAVAVSFLLFERLARKIIILRQGVIPCHLADNARDSYWRESQASTSSATFLSFAISVFS